MADPNTRQGKRTPVTLKIKFKSETLEQFIERYAVDVSQGGIFIRTKEPLAVGTQMKFEFQLRDASPLIAGEGTVVWTRENDPSRPAIAPGMGVRFDRLAEGSQTVLERILAEKAKQAPSRAATTRPTKPPMFTDTPTRVAPAPVQEALGVRATAARPTPSRRRCPSRCRSTPTPTTSTSRRSRRRRRSARSTSSPRRPRPRRQRRRATSSTTTEDRDRARCRPTSSRRAARRAAPTRRSPIRRRRAAARGARREGDPDRESAPGLPSPPEELGAAHARHAAVAAHRAGDPTSDARPSSASSRRRRDAPTRSDTATCVADRAVARPLRAEAAEQRTDHDRHLLVVARARPAPCGSSCCARTSSPRVATTTPDNGSRGVSDKGSNAVARSAATAAAPEQRRRDATGSDGSAPQAGSMTAARGSAVAMAGSNAAARPRRSTPSIAIAASPRARRSRSSAPTEGPGAVHRQAREGQAVQGAGHRARLRRPGDRQSRAARRRPRSSRQAEHRSR